MEAAALGDARSALDCGDSITALEGSSLRKLGNRIANKRPFSEELQRNCSNPRASGGRW